MTSRAVADSSVDVSDALWPMVERSAFAGGDQAYLRDVQYADGSRLDARSHLHHAYGTSAITFPAFESSLVAWADDARVLECGCGTGRFWETASLPRSLHLTLTDLSPGMVGEATSRARDNGFSDVTGQACDIQQLPFEDASFDVVVANHMLYHVPDPDRAVAEIARVLAPDGVALVATNGYGHMDEMNAARAEAFGSANEGLYEVFGIDTGERRLREGFSSLTWHAFVSDLLVTSVDDPVAYGLSLPPGEDADDAGRAAFRAAIERRFVDSVMRIRTRAGVFVCRQPRT